MKKVHGSQSMTPYDIDQVFGLTREQKGLPSKEDQQLIDQVVQRLNALDESVRKEFLERHHLIVQLDAQRNIYEVQGQKQTCIRGIWEKVRLIEELLTYLDPDSGEGMKSIDDIYTSGTKLNELFSNDFNDCLVHSLVQENDLTDRQNVVEMMEYLLKGMGIRQDTKRKPRFVPYWFREISSISKTNRQEEMDWALQFTNKILDSGSRLEQIFLFMKMLSMIGTSDKRQRIVADTLRIKKSRDDAFNEENDANPRNPYDYHNEVIKFMTVIYFFSELPDDVNRGDLIPSLEALFNGPSTNSYVVQSLFQKIRGQFHDYVYRCKDLDLNNEPIASEVQNSLRTLDLIKEHFNLPQLSRMKPENKSNILALHGDSRYSTEAEHCFALFRRAMDVFPLTEEDPLTGHTLDRFFTTLLRRRDGDYHTDVVGLFLPTMTSSQRIEILTSLESLRDHELSDTLYLLRQQVQDVIDPAVRVSLIQDGCHPDHQHHTRGVVDVENVMNRCRISKSAMSLRVLYSNQVTPGYVVPVDLVEQVKSYIRAINPKSERDPLFHKKRAGNSEINHALFVLDGERNRERGDYESLADNTVYSYGQDGVRYHMLGILGRVWYLIHAQPEEIRSRMLYGLVANLGQCFDEGVDDQGNLVEPHRVCDIGKVQRLLSVLQGYIPGIEIDDVESIPSVEAVLAQLTSDFFDSETNEHKVTASQGKEIIRRTAEEVYRFNTEQKSAFITQAQEFLNLLSEGDVDRNSRDINERRSVIEEQNAAYEASLEVDRKKEAQKEAATVLQKVGRGFLGRGQVRERREMRAQPEVLSSTTLTAEQRRQAIRDSWLRRDRATVL